MCHASCAGKSEDAWLAVQMFFTGRDCCCGRRERYHHFLGSSVCAERPARDLSGKSGVLQRASIVLLSFFAFLTGAMYSGAALHHCSGVRVQLHCVLVRWLGAQCWYGLLPFSSLSRQMSITAVDTTLHTTVSVIQGSHFHVSKDDCL